MAQERVPLSHAQVLVEAERRQELAARLQGRASEAAAPQPAQQAPWIPTSAAASAAPSSSGGDDAAQRGEGAAGDEGGGADAGGRGYDEGRGDEDTDRMFHEYRLLQALNRWAWRYVNRDEICG